MNTTLYRPVGLFELQKLVRAELRAWPAPLPQQPIFYPVLNRAYAAQIARDWNLDDPESGFSGFVTCFRVPRAQIAGYKTRTVGGKGHKELWVPSEELAELNAAMLGPIEVLEGWAGPRFAECCPRPLPLHAEGRVLERFLDGLADLDLKAWRPALLKD